MWRSWLGGSRLRAFRNEPGGADDHFPEDWVASTVRARNGENRQSPDEGISQLQVNGEEVPLTDLIQSHPQWFWGSQTPPVDEAGQTGILLKLLDASVRLHIQAHPDRAFVEKHFGGSAGKTECWYILSVRSPEAFVYLGFQHPPSPGEWARMVREQDLDDMQRCFEKIPVRPGDCLIVPAGVPHAIGEGVFTIELQEPTDWVVRCEFSAGGHVLEHDARFMGLELEEVLPLFDFSEHPCGQWRQEPETLRKTDSFIEERVIGYEHRNFFRMRRLSGSGSANWAGGEPMVLIVLEGGGLLDGVPVAAGETWLLPGAAKAWSWEPTSNDWNFLLAQPPVREGATC